MTAVQGAANGEGQKPLRVLMHIRCGSLAVYLLAPLQIFLYLKPFKGIKFKLAMVNINFFPMALTALTGPWPLLQFRNHFLHNLDE
jgi:hypothetical protein